MPKIENRWTWGNVAAVIAAVATMITIGITIHTWGQEWGKLLTRVDGLEETARQSATDSRTLIELRTDVAYIKQAVQNLSRDLQSASSTLPCPPDRPVLVASYCRGSVTASYE